MLHLLSLLRRLLRAALLFLEALDDPDAAPLFSVPLYPPASWAGAR